MALIIGMIARGLKSRLSDSHHEETHHQHGQDPHNSNQSHHHSAHHGLEHHYDQPHMHERYHHNNSSPMTQRPVGGHRAERHYRRAERTMMRAEHKAEKQCRRAERDIYRAERRGKIIPDASATHRPAFESGSYPARDQGYEMSDMRHYQQQGRRQSQELQPQHCRQRVHTPGLGSRDTSHTYPSIHQTDDVPPPAYEEVEKR